MIMFVKVLALCLVMGICLSIPVEDTKPPVPVPPAYASGMPVKRVKPPNADHSDLKTDPSTWWYTSWYNSYPTYYDYYHPRPTYTVWYPYYY